MDPGRLALLLAVLERRAGLRLADRDVFVNVVGGVTVDEPALDLAVAAAVISAAADVALPGDLRAVGEIGLLGEVRAVGPHRGAAARGGGARVLPVRRALRHQPPAPLRHQPPSP